MRAQLSGGVLSQFRGVYARGEKELGLNDEAVGPAEVGKWTDQAERLGRALNACALAARHASAREIAWLFQAHADAGARATRRRPRPGAGRGARARSSTSSRAQVHNGRTMLRLEHVSGE